MKRQRLKLEWDLNYLNNLGTSYQGFVLSALVFAVAVDAVTECTSS